MPQPFWRHVCDGREVLRVSPECRMCGRRGVFDGWRLKWWETLAVYHYVYGLNPMGPHRAIADQLFAGMRDPCVRCGGRAVLTLGDGSAWRACPDCEATGGFWNRPFEEVDAVWRQVVARWPGPATLEPAMPTRPRNDVPTSPVRNGAHGAVSTEAEPRTPREPAQGMAPQPVVRAGTKSSGRSIPRRRGYSKHGLRFADVQRAFAEAEQFLGTEWRLKGRGHCRRVSLDARYSGCAAKGAAGSWAWVTPHGTMSPRRLIPLAIVKRAARILGVPARLLISREY